jgi:hypothetical protein
VGIIAFVAFVIAVNAFVSHWLALRGHAWRSIIQEFAVMAVINLGIGIVGFILLPGDVDTMGLGTPLFFTLLLTLIVVLYDRYRPIHDARVAMAAQRTAGP